MADFSLEQLDESRYRVSGDLVFSSVSSLVARLDGCFRGELLVVDLSGVTQADSASLALLMEWERRALSKGVEISYANMPDQMVSIAGLSDLDDVLPRA